MNAVEIEQAITDLAEQPIEAVRRIRDGSITEFIYDPKTARLVGYARTHYKDEP